MEVIIKTKSNVILLSGLHCIPIWTKTQHCIAIIDKITFHGNIWIYTEEFLSFRKRDLFVVKDTLIHQTIYIVIESFIYPEGRRIERFHEGTENAPKAWCKD